VQTMEAERTRQSAHPSSFRTVLFRDVSPCEHQLFAVTVMPACCMAGLRRLGWSNAWALGLPDDQHYRAVLEECLFVAQSAASMSPAPHAANARGVNGSGSGYAGARGGGDAGHAGEEAADAAAAEVSCPLLAMLHMLCTCKLQSAVPWSRRALSRHPRKRPSLADEALCVATSVGRVWHSGAASSS